MTAFIQQQFQINLGVRLCQRPFRKNGLPVRIVFLPSYSPELIPDELLNQDVQSNAPGRQRPGNQTQLMCKLRRYRRSRQCKPDIVAH
ncbi:MAG: hypothetical protein JRI57_09925 [Deltaproteobacteria bacterium]|nr:hypothetical protein [Deltaproteobacteria bacterium]